jgi:HSP20 family protein
MGGGPKVRIHVMEIDHGPFCREVDVPENVDKERISATHRNGLLWIELPKAG